MRNSEIARCISVGSDISSSLGVVIIVVDSPVPLPASGPAVGQRLRRTVDMSGAERGGRSDLEFWKERMVKCDLVDFLGKSKSFVRGCCLVLF
jgi:hypothetical protein